MIRRLDDCHSIEDLRQAARRRLPRMVFEFVEGGSDDERTLQWNREAFARYQLNPKVLVDVSDIETSTTVLGRTLELPIILAPVGAARLAHHEGELAIARAAEKAGIIYALPSMGNFSIEDVAEVTEGPLWFQIYVWRDRSLLRDYIDRCRAQGYAALCLTVDVPVLGNRERDLKYGMTIPPRFKLRSILDAAMHPRWWWHLLLGQRFTMANVVGRAGMRDDIGALSAFVKSQFDPSVTWRDVEWMLGEWNGPFAIKGILRPEDAARAADLGVQAIVVSNHGGRQLDGTPSALDVLPEIVDAVGDRTEVILDGGIRRGSDIVKALALGARACMIGRSYLYGLAAGGQHGVTRAMEMLESETRRTLALVGCRTPAELDHSVLRPSPSGDHRDRRPSDR